MKFRRTRPSHRRAGWYRYVGKVTVTTTGVILKEMYPQPGSWEKRRPEAFYIAKKFGWITSARFWAEPPVLTGKRHAGISLSTFPLFGLVKR